eukprot:CAMPEP_0181236920 /NCGR_PEP_ID=MMETSP1096-20121128/38459_1 /TAXON_ID=156174 ORGANISM="Chrysochromulina ericina, Strain CCMP281" /NCGR_SAMPLE_ID=MMETSP1096 /ASSEMBLY_ACC=CAM_ASM_000453 /LENGTH=44 /DNA_ID= /DNA_START= /DNA_END= /DNA_ORIENTATION=
MPVAIAVPRAKSQRRQRRTGTLHLDAKAVNELALPHHRQLDRRL